MHGYYIKTMVKEKLEDQGILKCLLSQTINIIKMCIRDRIYSVQQAVDKAEQEKDSSAKVLLLFKRIQYVLDAVKQGLDIKEVNLGNLGSLAGRKSISKNVNLNPAEIEMVKELMEKGLTVYLQMLYTDSKVDIKNMI